MVNRRWWWLSLIGVGCILFGIAWKYLYVKTEDSKLVEKVAKLIILPDEVPEVATVSDKNKLMNMGFFEKAENGDKVLFFEKSGRAVLYRPEKNIVVDVTTMTIVKEVSPTPVILTSVEKPLKVAIYNGTKRNGLSTVVEDAIKSAKIEWEVVAKKKTARSNYPETLAIKINNRNFDSSKIMEVLGAKEVMAVPEGEVAPDADLLIILGNDWLK